MAQRLTTYLIAAMLLAVFAGAAQAQPKGQGPPPALVVLSKVEQASVRPQVVLNGTAQPFRLITVASRVGEIVGKVLVEEGQTVAVGQELVKLEPSQLKLRQAQAVALLREGELRLAQLTRDLGRTQALYEKKTIPLKRLEDARTAMARQRAVVGSNRELVKLLGFDLRHATIKSPAAGVIVARLVNEGEWVKKGGPLVRLSVLDPIKAVAKVPERYLPHLKVGQEVCSTADAMPGKTYCGTIAAIVPSGDPHSHTFPVQILVANPEGRIKPGMHMRMRLDVAAARPALLVPKDALVVSTGGQSIFIVNGGKAFPVQVKVQGFHGDRVAVAGRLKAGQAVVVVGNERLRPGQPVRERGAAPGKPPAKKPGG